MLVQACNSFGLGLRKAAQAAAERLLARHPADFTSNMKKMIEKGSWHNNFNRAIAGDASMFLGILSHESS